MFMPNIRPILRAGEKQTPVRRAARKISRKVRRIRFRSKNEVIDITPLPDKRAGVVRMPSEDDEEENVDVEMIEKDNDKEKNITISSMLLNKQPRQPLTVTTSSTNMERIVSIPLNLSLDPDENAKKSLVETSNPPIVPIQFNSNSWSVEETEAYELAVVFAKNHLKTKSELWPNAFAPASRSELFNNVSRLYNWLSEWRKRLSTQPPADRRKNKRKRKSTMYDDDEDYEIVDRELPNPFIVSGPCGSGKTSAVYCAASENSMKVIEFSTADRRNGVTLDKRLSGAINSHYICSSPLHSGDIRQMFSPKASKLSSSAQVNETATFSVALIDDCDIIYPNDDNFWSTLRAMCDDAKIPIILTCTNFDYVKKMLLPGFSFGFLESLHFAQPTVLRLSRHLRAWLVGYKQKLVSFEWLKSVIEMYRGDIRAVLNHIHFNLSAKRLEDYKKRKVVVKSALLPLKNHARHLRTLSELDAAFGVPQEEVTWRGGISTRLDAQPDADVVVAEHMALREQLNNWLNTHIVGIDITSERLNYRFSVTKPLKAICDARMRSRRMVYPWKSVALDYVPCLWAIDEAFHNSIRNRVNAGKREDPLQNPTGSTARTRSKNCYNDRAQHPFDVYDQATGLTIDVTEELRTSIAKYAFSNLYRPTY